MTIKLRFDHTKLTVGARFFEDVYGNLLEFEVTSEPIVEADTCLRWTARGLTHPGLTDFFVRQGYEHYGPKIYLPEEIVEHNGLKFLSR